MEAFRSTAAPDRKKKRSAPEPDRPKSNSADGEKAEAAAETSKPSSAPTRPPPSEEEVEEFFTLLRRIHSAAKRSGTVNGKVRSTIFEREVPLTLPLLNGGPSKGKMDRVEEEGADSGVMIIDLDAVPDEADEASGG